MQLKIKSIEKKEFVELLSTTPVSDRKWLISFFHGLETLPLLYKVEDKVSQKIIGLTYSTEIKDQQDFSLIIFPQFQRQGFGKDLIFYFLENYENTSFTVSSSNIRMLSLMNKISLKYRLIVDNLDMNRFQFKIRKNSEMIIQGSCQQTTEK
jgi:RimJ/RimL family protein N-acetyltransferase